MTESLRNQDMKAENELANFMDSYFYSQLVAKDGGKLSYKRISDRRVQLNGVDVCIEAANREMLIDEKASVYYSNVMIPTFAFELDSIQGGHSEPVEGWFINDELKTEYYMLIWPNIKCIRDGNQWIRKDIKDISKDDFTIVEAMLIKKSDIRKVLERNGYDRPRLIEYSKKMRELYSKENSKQEKELMENVKITFSGQLAEKPINLVIRKELLKKLAKGIYLISEDGCAAIRG